jgi:Carbohydrate binding domain (family 11)
MAVGCGVPEGFKRALDSGTSASTGAGGSLTGTGGAGSFGGAGTGSAGSSAGVAGTTGVAGAIGSGGVLGTAGASGTTGAAGSTGTAGQSGTTGTAGTGVAGMTGAAGANGTAGAGTAGAGAAGTTGAAGNSGTAGAMGAASTTGAAGTGGSAGTAGAGGTGDKAVTGACAGKVHVLSATIATFEDGSLTGWYEYKDASTGTTLNALAITMPGASTTTRALRLSGTALQAFGAGVGFGIGCGDASAFQGISFWAKGTSGTSNDIALQVAIPATHAVADGGDCTTKCFDHPQKKVLLGVDWQQYHVKLTDLAQAGFGTPATYGGLIMALNWVSLEGPNVDFSIDEIAFY